MTRIDTAVVALLEHLERIMSEHEEVTDTDVRDSIHLALTYYFVWAQELQEIPRSFGMFSAEGDRLVASAILEFLHAVERSEELPNIPVGQPRFDLLQADSAVTASGARYDLFYGYRDAPIPLEPLPKIMFEEDDYEEWE